jgi:hypothetical protein
LLVSHLKLQMHARPRAAGMFPPEHPQIKYGTTAHYRSDRNRTQSYA